MSHFNVAVFTRDGQDIEDLLAPYSENDESYFEFVSGSEQFGENYVRDTTQKVKLPNGDYIDMYSCKIEITEEEFERLQGVKGVHTMRDWDHENGTRYYKVSPESFGGELVDVKMCELYPTIENYLRDYWELTWDEEHREYGYYSNPNSKWDWWMIGGRWAGMLKAKEGTYGEPSLLSLMNHSFEDFYPNDETFDSAKVKDIDFSPNQEAYAQCIRWWEVVVDGEPLKDGEDGDNFHTFYRIEYLKERYGDKYAYAKEETEFATFAVVTPDGEWHEASTMGWFGCTNGTVDQERAWFANYFDNFIKTADPEWTLTIVDCHI